MIQLVSTLRLYIANKFFSFTQKPMITQLKVLGPKRLWLGSTVLPKPNVSFVLAYRYKSNVPDHKDKKPPEINQQDWKTIQQFIPGEKVQGNDLKDRMPKFPLGKENVPTLLPKPNVPKVSKTLSFRQVINILKNRTEPELIYESEPHRLYFLICFCFGATMLIYGCVLGEYAFFQANKDFEDNEQEKNEIVRKREWLMSLLKNSTFSLIAFSAAYGILTLPNRLVRRMYYLPGPVEHIRLTTYPLVPGRPTPVVTIPLSNISRKHRGRVWTGKGFYGTSDNSLFFFVLREADDKNKTIKNWVVDRKGFFWSDGRVFDYIFGKETIAEAEAGIPYDEQIGIVDREVQRKNKELRQKHGLFYKYKLQGQEMKKDFNKLKGKVIGDKKQLPGGDK